MPPALRVCGILNMKTLWIFNPETELALGADSAFYTPPRNIVDIRRRMALFPVNFAHSGDAVLLLDAMPDDYWRISPEWLRLAELKGIDIFYVKDQIVWQDYTASPWGWNDMIRRILSEDCPGLKGIPTVNYIKSLRNLAHRKSTIRFLSSLPPGFTEAIQMPVIFTSSEEAIEYYRNHPNIFIKAPWSSSGRGVMRTDDLLPLHVEPWIRGIIRSQGSVIVEPIYEKSLDFATEWMISGNKSEYLGISVFEASGRGKYHRNFEGTQSDLQEMIRCHTLLFEPALIHAQSDVLNDIIAPDYNGPVGIDMMILKDGRIHPCVEINLRHTMGSVRLYS